MKRNGIVWLLALLLMIACQADEQTPTTGNLVLEFQHVFDEIELMYDQMIYENEAGNLFEVTNIQWFISDIALRTENGDYIAVDGEDWIQYVDTDLPQTHRWELQNGIPAGSYTGLKFTFGIKGEKNIPNRFVNPPESNMFWPYPLGGEEGGYHYMKLNGFWMNPEEERTPFNFHLGVGQIYDLNGDVIDFVQNWFEKELQVSMQIKPDQTTKLNMAMNIRNWFRDPNIYDHNVYGGKIMNNQEAMGKITSNGENVFNIETANDESAK
jgi:hypothetical protein